MNSNSGAIAVIGMSGRFPGAATVDEFLAGLRAGRENVVRFDENVLRAKGVPDETIRDPAFVSGSATIRDADCFDAAFFRYSPREAALLDPQHRVALENAYETFEDGGYDPRAFAGRIGVYCGAGLGTYWLGSEIYRELTGPSPAAAFFANAPDFLATRLAYKLNTTGPALNVQTACSTALVAVHLACQSLLSGDADMALAGAVDLYFFNSPGYFYERGGNLSPDGRCRAFDAKAGGTIPGRGAGFVLLKPLDEALRDRDRVHAVIRGSAVNNDGAEKVGYTAPSVGGQADVIHEAHAMAGFAPDSVDYLETHGTGTVLGDPIEIRALSEVFRPAPRGSIGIGSVKTSIGHLGAAAGIAGMIKTILSLKHGELFASLHFESPNPELGLEQSPFYVVNERTPWNPSGGPRRAGVSAFGIGGTNAHLALEEFRTVETAPAPSRKVAGETRRPPVLLALSAGSQSALEKMTGRLADYLRASETDIHDAAFTLALGRPAMGLRRVVVGDSRSELIDALESPASPGRIERDPGEASERQAALLLPGQGAEYANMCADLYAGEPVFRSEVDRCAQILAGLDFDLPGALDPAKAGPGRTERTQPALFAVEYAFARLLEERGVRSSCYLGHSLGEYTAACLAGVFELKDALRLLRMRGTLMARTPPGAMLAVAMAADQVGSVLGPELSLAAINAPERIVLSGTAAAVNAAQKELKERGIESRLLNTDRGFHSHLMDSALNDFRALLETTPLRPPSVPFVSNLTGTWIRPEEATNPDYWVRHMRSPVRFAEGATLLLNDPNIVLLETGPGTTLSSLARGLPGGRGRVFSAGISERENAKNDSLALSGALGRLWCAGLRVDWDRYYQDRPGRRTSLPSYPFERRRFALGPAAFVPLKDAAAAPLPNDQAPAGLATTSEDKNEGAGNTSKTLLKLSTFQRWPLPPRPDRAPGRAVFFLDAGGLAERASKTMEDESGLSAPLLIRPGETFAKIGAREYRLNPASEADHRLLFEELARLDAGPLLVCDFRACDPIPETVGLNRNHLHDAQDCYLNRPLLLTRALAHAFAGNMTNAVELIFFTTQVCQALGNETPRPEKALLLGPLAVVPREYPGIHCRLVDLEPGDGAVNGAASASDIRRELLFRPEDFAGQNIAAYRAGARWTPVFTEMPLERTQGMELKQKIRPGGVYVIAGGTGGVGRLIAERLAGMADLKLALISREARGPAEISGRPVLNLSADIADREATERALNKIRAELGPINGIVNAAGIVAGGFIADLAAERSARTLAPKVSGTVHLLEGTRDDPLDFVILCSSMAVFSGYEGQTDYSAANAFLDAFAARRFVSGGPAAPNQPAVLSVNWDRWRETGMARTSTAGHPAPRTPSPAATRKAIELNARRDWVLDEHRYENRALFPGTAYIEAVRATFAVGDDRSPVRFDEVIFLNPLFVDDDRPAGLEIILEEPATGPASGTDKVRDFSARSLNAAGTPGEHLTGRIRTLSRATPPRVPDAEIETIKRRCDRDTITPEKFLRMLDSTPLKLGGRWRAEVEIFRGESEAFANIALPETFAAETESYVLHPAVLDLCLGFARLEDDGDPQDEAKGDSTGVYLPLSYRNCSVYRPLEARSRVHARLVSRAGNGETIAYEIRIMNAAGEVAVHVENFTVKRVRRPELFAAEATAGGPGGLSPDAALEAFENLPAGLVPSVQVLALDEKFGSRFAAGTEPAREKHARPELPVAFAAPDTPMQRTVAELWETALGLAGIGIHDNFFELGGDSLLALRIVPRAREKGLSLEPGTLFQFPTVAALAEYFEEQSGGKNSEPSRLGQEQTKKSEPDVDADEIARALKTVKFRTRNRT